jgi:hypothetical protein
MYYLFDTVNFSLMWTGPPSRSQAFPFSIVGAPLAGADRNNLIFVNESTETMHTGNATYTYDISTITVYDNTSLEESWNSGAMRGVWWIRCIWDFDNDSNIEVLFSVMAIGSMVSHSVAIIEFPRGTEWPEGIDTGPPSVRIKAPVSGSGIHTDINITGDAQDDLVVDAVAVRIDNGSWLDAVRIYPERNTSCNWSLFWNTSGLENGSHIISVRAFDGEAWSQPVSVNVNFMSPVTEPPDGNQTRYVPTTSISDFPLPLCASAAGLAIIIAAVIMLARRK